MHKICDSCGNRGQVNGLSQESFCSSCIWHETWRKDHSSCVWHETWRKDHFKGKEVQILPEKTNWPVVHAEMVTRLRKPGKAIMQTITPEKLDLLHMAGCICEEAGELFGAVKKSVFYNKQLDMTNIVEELGDLEFYMEGLRQILDISRDKTLVENVMKLDSRYATGKYSDAQAQARADKTGEAKLNEVERGSGHEW